MKNKLISLIMALMMLVTPVIAEETAGTNAAEQSVPRALSVFQQQQIIKNYAHMLADNYYYGAEDENLLYNVICATIENDGVFDIDIALEAMVKSLGDQYAEYYSPESYAKQTEYYDAEFFGIGVTLTISGGGTVVENVYSGSSAEMAGIQAGDKIIAVDGTDTSKSDPSSTRELIVGEEGTFVDITVLRGEEILTVRAVRQKISQSHSSMRILDNNIAYIDIESFTSSLPEEFDSYIAELTEKNISKVIIDLRDNGGGDIDAAISVAQKLIPAGIIGKLKYKDESRNTDLYSENLNAPRYKMLVLVNENTASASEFLAMALQSRGRAKLLGTSTYGKGCMQVLMRTPTGSGLKFTIGEFYSPKDERVQRYGLEPDIEVENIVTPVDEDEFESMNLTELDSWATRLGIEQRLNALRLLDDIEVDGEYNNRTEAAVRVFQQYSQLEVTGVVDFYTAMYINDYEYNMNKIIDVQMQEALKYFE
ncbi:MAG: S41 family peptidase [Clostridia bacterium]